MEIDGGRLSGCGGRWTRSSFFLLGLETFCASASRALINNSGFLSEFVRSLKLE